MAGSARVSAARVVSANIIANTETSASGKRTEWGTTDEI